MQLRHNTALFTLLRILQEGSHDGAKSALTSFQSMVSNQLAKMEKDFQSGKAFPDLPIIRDTKAFQVADHCLMLPHLPFSTSPGSPAECYLKPLEIS